MEKQISKSLIKRLAVQNTKPVDTSQAITYVGSKFTKIVDNEKRVFEVLNLVRIEDHEFYIVGMREDPDKPASITNNVLGIVGIPKRKMISVIQDPSLLILK